MEGLLILCGCKRTELMWHTAKALKTGSNCELMKYLSREKIFAA